MSSPGLGFPSHSQQKPKSLQGPTTSPSLFPSALLSSHAGLAAPWHMKHTVASGPLPLWLPATPPAPPPPPVYLPGTAPTPFVSLLSDSASHLSGKLFLFFQMHKITNPSGPLALLGLAPQHSLHLTQ